MTSKNLPGRDAFASALMAIANLLESDFSQLENISWTEAIVAHSEIEQRPLPQKRATFYRHFLPLRQRMTALLGESYRRLFKVALANPSQTRRDPDTWARTQLQPAVSSAVEWIRGTSSCAMVKIKVWATRDHSTLFLHKRLRCRFRPPYHRSRHLRLGVLPLGCLEFR
jgi:hypothetical protein